MPNGTVNQLSVRDAHVTLGGTPIVRGASLEVHAGEVHLLIGPNGAGKTTFANAVTGGVHVNTLRYRLARIEKCTGRDPASMAERVDFYVALRARQARPRPAGRPAARVL